MVKTALLSCLVCLLAAAPALAQAPAARPAGAPPCHLTLGDALNASAHSTKTDGDQMHLVGEAEIQPDCSTVKFSADVIDIDTKLNRIVASGNVVFVSPDGRIAAESIEFDMNTGNGTFHQATGVMSLGPKADRKQFGNQDPDVYFHGEQIEKLGPQKYHITNGGFTTCVQPTPRWALGSANIDLNLNDYAIARNMVLRVKDVPLLYLPWIYYPIQNDDRATGFLLPTYGTSNLRGQSLSNAFFWAIGRSQDATFFHDWFTRSGQGAGAEYRYVLNPQSSGNVRYYLLDQKRHTYESTGQSLPSARSYELVGNMTDVLTPHLRARARVDYVSDIATQQLYNQNVYRMTNPMRTIDGNLMGAWRTVSTSASFQRTETFSSVDPTLTQSTVYGSTPRVSTTIAPQRIFGMPIYAGLASEYAFLPYRSIRNDVVIDDRSLTRIDLAPTARIPLSTLSFLTVNSSATYRTTYYSRSLDASGATVDEPLTRRYLTVRTSVIGPVLTKIWDTPTSGFSQRMKHVIEPTFTVDYFTDITNYKATPVLTDSSDKVIGGLAQYTYGLNNRLFYRTRPVDGGRSITREFMTIGVQQTYYTNPEASVTDSQYTSRSVKEASVSPVALTARFSPTTAIDANSRVEYDTSSGLGLRSLSVGTSVNSHGSAANVTFSHVPAAPLVGIAQPSTYLNGSTSLTFRQARFRSLYALSWDIYRSTIVSQRVQQSYLAQCCGFDVEYQVVNYAPGTAPITNDRRMNFSFILAGLGTFSNFFGAFGGQR